MQGSTVCSALGVLRSVQALLIETCALRRARAVQRFCAWRRCTEILIFRRADCASRTAIATKIGFVLIIPGRAPIRPHIQGPHDTLAGLALFLVPFS